MPAVSAVRLTPGSVPPPAPGVWLVRLLARFALALGEPPTALPAGTGWQSVTGFQSFTARVDLIRAGRWPGVPALPG